MNIYKEIMLEFVHRQCAHVDIYPGHFANSIGGHLFNLMNQEKEVLVANGIPVDTRMHVMMVAPPGFSKTFWQEQYLRGSWCILEETDIFHGFEGSTTEAGFVGSAMMADGEAVITPGLAYIYQNGIVGFEEFSALIAMLRSTHSRQLDAALLLALDKGYVVKRLRAGKIGYKTNVTVWCGTQPARFDLTSGLGRRFYYLLLIPTKKDKELIRKKMRTGWNVRMNKKRTDRIRAHIDMLRDQLYEVKKVVRTKEFNDLMDELNMPPYEEPLYIRSLIGYKCITGDFDSQIVLDIDDTFGAMCHQEAVWRKAIRRGPEIAEVLSILRENGGKMTIVNLKDALMDFGIDWRRSAELINELKAMRVITVGDSTVSLRGKWRDVKEEEKDG